jgi:hypothetical protein
MKPEQLEAMQRRFSLFWGGPFNRLFRLTGWADGSAPNVATRIAASLLVTLLPLVVLTLIEGTAYGPSRTVPLFGDISVLVRLLLCLPLLIGTEVIAQRGVSYTAEYFRTSGLVDPSGAARFEALERHIDRISDSLFPELGLLVLAVSAALTSGTHPPAVASHWSLALGDGGYTAAGQWYRLVSLTLYRFLLLRWLWRYGLWVWFLVSLSRLPLTLSASHPDRAGGLRILSTAQKSFIPFVLTISLQLSSQMALWVIYEGMPLSSQYYPIAGYAGLALVVFLGPLAAFGPSLFDCKRRGFVSYGALGERYTAQFEQRWLGASEPGSEPLLGTADIQSLADLANSYEVVRQMSVVPFGREDVLPLVAAALAPFLPLLLLVYPVAELVERVAKLVF